MGNTVNEYGNSEDKFGMLRVIYVFWMSIFCSPED